LAVRCTLKHPLRRKLPLRLYPDFLLLEFTLNLQLIKAIMENLCDFFTFLKNISKYTWLLICLQNLNIVSNIKFINFRRLLVAIDYEAFDGAVKVADFEFVRNFVRVL
jgi:hypothetical protein